MAAPSIEPILDHERQEALDTLVLAFATDPVIRWLYLPPSDTWRGSRVS